MHFQVKNIFKSHHIFTKHFIHVFFNNINIVIIEFRKILFIFTFQKRF
jgi:hypothetical protein